MAITVASLLVEIGANTGNLVAGIASASAGMGGLGPLAAAAGAGVLAFGAIAGAAVLAFGAASVMAAGNFQAGMTSLVTGAGEAQSNIKMVGAGVKQLADDTGQSTKSLIDGMYMIESAGFHGKSGLDVLKASAEGAAVGNAKLADVANGVTTELTDYSKAGYTANDATNILIATVANGKTHMADLAKSMASILPTASAVGASLIDVQGAMATMTGEGVPAAQAATFLRQTLLALDAPSAGTVKALASVGLSSTQVSDAMKKSLPDALAMITDAVGKKFPVGSAQYVEAIKAIAGGSKQMQGILDLTGDHMTTYRNNVASITDAVHKGAGGITGWAQVQGNFNTVMARAKEHVETFMISTGEKLLPVVTGVIAFMLDKGLPAIVGFGEAIAKGLVPVIITVASFIGQNLIPAVMQIASSLRSQLGPVVANLTTTFHQLSPALADAGQLVAALMPFIKILAAVIGATLVIALGVAVGALRGLAEAFTGIMTVVSGVASFLAGVLNIIVGLFTLNGDKIKLGLGQVWVGIQDIIRGGASAVIGLISGFVVGTLSFIDHLTGGMLSKIGAGIGSFIGWFVSLPGKVGDAIGSLPTVISDAWQHVLKVVEDFGAKLIASIVSGIESNAGAVGNAIKTTVNNIPVVGGIASAMGFAGGTDDAPGGYAVVGERGPELVNLPRHSGVLPARPTADLLSGRNVSGGGGGQSGDVTVVAQLMLDGRVAARALMPHIYNQARAKGIGPNR